MAFELIELPYPMNGLEPYISAETLEYHYGKHHRTYVNNLNNLVPDTQFESMSLVDIVKTADGGIFNNAAQDWNHSFYWQCMKPKGGGEPSGALLEAIKRDFGSFSDFKDKFSKTAMTTFGSGWAWLIKNPAGQLSICSTSNAGNPMTDGNIPLLTCDVWEHAYYIDYRNARPKYLEAFWKLVNWDFVAEKLAV